MLQQQLANNGNNSIKWPVLSKQVSFFILIYFKIHIELRKEIFYRLRDSGK